MDSTILPENLRSALFDDEHVLAARALDMAKTVIQSANHTRRGGTVNLAHITLFGSKFERGEALAASERATFDLSLSRSCGQEYEAIARILRIRPARFYRFQCMIARNVYRLMSGEAE